MNDEERQQIARIEQELAPRDGSGSVGRRAFLGTAAAVAASLTPALARAAKEPPKSLAASPPAGFSPFNAPGKVVKVTKADSLQANKLYPKPEAAKEMLTKALTELTGKPDLVTAVQQFVHKDDVVVVKVNGIAQSQMATGKELVLPFVEAMIEGGIDPEKITLLEQYAGFFNATRITAQNAPKGVKIATHANGNATMDDRLIPGTGTRTKFVRWLTEATAAINFALIKDHSICGYTGALKNMTHGCTINPHDFHVHHASPQIALLYAQDVVKSRVRLCIADGFKVMADGGPLYKRPEFVKPHDAVYVSTDPVAIDTIGWEVVEKYRADFKLKTLTEVGREPAYIKAAADLGLGIHERAKIHLKEVTV
ncbi:MAG: DUF362 domain-containing protein [Labilithrix sp.]|nr:DUF362 domain-containing protein [Labilithrix sp.]MCW5837157.1 DUF362 domain-containing protein [Labilithrix sp.]